MPSVSEKQHNAMEAAAHGHSTLGIPKKVGEEFVAADESAPKNDRSIFEYMEPPKNAAPEMRDQHAQCYACRMLVPKDAMPAEGKHKKGCDLCVVLGSQEAVDGGEDCGSCGEFASWPTPDATPDPGVVKEHAGKLAEGAGGSASKEEVGYVERAVRCENCFYGGNEKCGWYEELNEKLGDYFHEDRPIEPKACCNSQTPKKSDSDRVSQAQDSAMAMDRSFGPRADSRFEIAMDRDSVREKTRDGRLIVKRTHVSKANVCPYRGEEIPGWEEIGLEPDRVYFLLRDPEELAKAAPTLNGVQLLIKHVPVSADDHHPYETVGSLGTDAEFDGEYLDNSLFVNSQEAIDAIETGRQQELSAGYHYKPDMTPGNFRGTDYDGVMRDIVFNHVALVEDGRAGPDVVVGDEALKESEMAKPTRFAAVVLNHVAAKIAPQIAMDQKITLPVDLFKSLTTKNFNASKKDLLAGIRKAAEGKLRKGIALDASMEDLAKAVDAFSGMEASDEPFGGKPEEVEEAAKVGPIDKPEPQKKDFPPGAESGEKKGFDAEPMKAFLREKGMGEDDIQKVCDMMPPEWQNIAAGGPSSNLSASPAGGDEFPDKDEKDKDMVSKPAMDAALQVQAAEFQKQLKALKDNERGVRVAIAEVAPWVGEIDSKMAFDSAADVYRHALVMRSVDGAKTLHADALLPILKTLPKAGARAPEHHSSQTIAMDAVDKALKLAPGLENISTL
jgi:hypothetical protein